VLGQVRDELGGATGVAVVTDTTVGPLHAERLTGLADAPRLALEPGAGAKSWAALERTVEFLRQAGLDRAGVVVALGGGVVGDLAGFAAAIYMRGVPVVQCPTTLLAQVDAAIGGKTAIDHAGVPNLVGAFHAPRAVLADPLVLATLPEPELRAGLGEAVKTALIGDPELLDVLDRTADAILARDPGALADVVRRCAAVKGRVVTADEREAGEREVLNLGHTFAHAIEQVAGRGRVAHGRAVAVGLGLALGAARELDRLADPELPERTAALLGRLGLPTTLSDLRAELGAPLATADLLVAMASDKKARGGALRLVLPRRAGDVERGIGAPTALLERLLA
jgi:3-dehydroquinate synthase